MGPTKAPCDTISWGEISIWVPLSKGNFFCGSIWISHISHGSLIIFHMDMDFTYFIWISHIPNFKTKWALKECYSGMGIFIIVTFSNFCDQIKYFIIPLLKNKQSISSLRLLSCVLTGMLTDDCLIWKTVSKIILLPLLTTSICYHCFQELRLHQEVAVGSGEKIYLH